MPSTDKQFNPGGGRYWRGQRLVWSLVFFLHRIEEGVTQDSWNGSIVVKRLIVVKRDDKPL
jgi:hypothetical protein